MNHLPQVRCYRVTVYYQEPTYEARVGSKSEPYRWTFEVATAGEAAARVMALEQFRAAARLSSVGWVREVVAVDVIPSIGPRA